MSESRYGDEVQKVLLSEEQLQTRIQEMADKVSQEYKDIDDDLILVCVLKGAVYFPVSYTHLTLPTILLV